MLVNAQLSLPPPHHPRPEDRIPALVRHRPDIAQGSPTSVRAYWRKTRAASSPRIIDRRSPVTGGPSPVFGMMSPTLICSRTQHCCISGGRQSYRFLPSRQRNLNRVAVTSLRLVLGLRYFRVSVAALISPSSGYKEPVFTRFNLAFPLSSRHLLGCCSRILAKRPTFDSSQSPPPCRSTSPRLLPNPS